MAGLDEIKAQLLRGVVQDNVNVRRDLRVRRIKPPRRTAEAVSLGSGSIWVGMIFLIMTLALAPKAMAPTMTNAPHPQSIATLSLPPSIATPSSPPAEAEIFTEPRPIDRATIPLSIKTVVIDAGHGGEPGAMSESGLMEKEITLDVALRLQRLLQDAPFKVLLTRETDRSIPLDKRVSFANQKKADLFLSIHANWMEPRSIRAMETYYVGPTDDPATLTLASRENKDSGFSLSEYKKILEKIYVDVRRDESRRFAHTIQSQLFHSLKSSNPALEDRGVKTAPFVVLIGTQMPAILVEIACLSNEEEVALLTMDDYRENIALALARGIRSYANTLKVADRKGS